MKRTRRQTEMEESYLRARDNNVLLAPKAMGDRALLARRVKDGEAQRGYPGVYSIPSLEDDFSLRVEALTVIRTVAQKHPDWCFTAFSAALVYGLWVPYGKLSHLYTCVDSLGCARHAPHIIVRRIKEPEIVSFDGVRLTSLRQTVAECALLSDFPAALPIADSALRFYDLEYAGLCGYARSALRGRHGVSRALRCLEHASALAESGGESAVRGAIIQAGYMPPTELQRAVANPVDVQGGFRVDMFWEFEDGRQLIGEVDGAEKYVDPKMLNGKTTSDAIIAERQRESLLNATGIPVMRILVKRLFEPGYLERRLDAFGVPRDLA